MLTARRQAIGGTGTCTPLDCGLVGCSFPFNPLTTFQTKESWLDTFRARFGYAWDRWFFYGTAGGAVVGEDFDLCNPFVGCTNESKSVFGWSAGLGVEYTLWRMLSFKLE
jgi:opacity protein-like surface antigen